MYGELPVAYMVKKNIPSTTKWYLKNFDEKTGTCEWTAKPLKAHLFTSESGCKDFITKYLRGRDCESEQRIINPYAYAMGFIGG